MPVPGRAHRPDATPPDRRAAGLSRRSVIAGAAWLTPAVLVAVASPASGGIIAIIVTPTGNEDEIEAQVVIPPEFSIDDITVIVTWTSQPAGAQVEVGPDLGWVPSAVSTDQPAVFLTPAEVSSSGSLFVTITKGQQVSGPSNDFTVAIDATVVQTGDPVHTEVSADYA